MERLIEVFGLMRAGRFKEARGTLEQLLLQHPHVAEIHRLLGDVLLALGDIAGGERALRSTLRLEPQRADSWTQLGAILAHSGRKDEAEAALRQALTLGPGNAETAVALARVLLAANRAPDARRVLDDFVKATPSAPAGLHLLHAQLLLSLGALVEAIEAFRQVLRADPTNGVAELGLAVALGQSGCDEEAGQAARNAIAKGADSPGARYVLARALFAAGRTEEAEQEFRWTLQLHTDHVDAHTNLADLVWMRTGDARAAARELDRALDANPDLVALRIVKARLLAVAGDVPGALDELGRGLTRRVGAAELHLAAAQIMLTIDAQGAAAHAERALALAPRSAQVLAVYGDAMLALGNAERAARVAERLRQIDPQDGHAIALQASAWRMMGDPRYRSLYDYERFVVVSTIDAPDGWTDLSGYLSALERSLRHRHELVAPPINQTLRAGTQVQHDFGRSKDAAIRAFPAAIDGSIRRYLATMGSGPDLPGSRNTGRYRISGAWSVLLRPHGHHLNHFHGKGWLSSACYIHVPGAVDGDDRQGWIKFGEPAMPTTPPLPAEHFVRPEPGKLVLFPSWMWHGTVPFPGGPDDTRLTVAFDIVPA